MKKSVLFLGLGLILFSACKKNYTCSCKIQDKDSTGYVYNSGGYHASIKSKSEEDVKSGCETDAKASHGTSPTSGLGVGDTRTFTCTVTKE